jgi:quercetin dioxygenase-like cupin family protein
MPLSKLLAKRRHVTPRSACPARPHPRPGRRGLENPFTGERATILELPHTNSEGRATAELTALVRSRVAGEHRHPALVERFIVLEGELTLKLNGQTSILREGDTGVIEPGVWHDWRNASDSDARARVEVTPGERFAHMIETMFGLARLGHTNAQGMPPPLQLALTAREFSDVIVFRSPRRRFSAYSSASSHRSRARAGIARPTRSSHARCWRRGRNSARRSPERPVQRRPRPLRGAESDAGAYTEERDARLGERGFAAFSLLTNPFRWSPYSTSIRSRT